MPINVQSKQEYLLSRDVFVESYKDFLRKLLGLLDEAEHSTGEADVRRDVANFAGEVKVLHRHIDDFQGDEARAKQAAAAAAAAAAAGASSSGSPRGASSQEAGRASSPGEEIEAAATGAPSESAPVPVLDGTAPPQSLTSSESKQQKSGSKTRSDSADELQAEVESQPSQLTASSEEVEDVPQVFAPAPADDGRVVSAFCAFRYHKAEFRELFMRQGSNNNSSIAREASNSCCLEADLPTTSPPDWLGPLAHYTLHLMRSAFRTAEPKKWDALKAQLSGFGFKAEEHFALWLRLSSGRDDVEMVGEGSDPGRVFNAIPPLATLPRRLAAETKIMLLTLNLLSK